MSDSFCFIYLIFIFFVLNQNTLLYAISWKIHDLLIKQDLSVAFACNVQVIYDLLFSFQTE